MKNLELVNWLKGAKYRIKLLLALDNNPSLPSELAKQFSISRVSVSRVLRDLKEEGLLEFTKKKAKTKTYYLTKKGKEMLSDIK